jgi:Fe-S cluster assembly ATP-binding protein
MIIKENEFLLDIKGLTVYSKKNKKIIDNLSLVLKKNELSAIMGPNGSGKSTLTKTLIGDPQYVIKGGSVFFKNKSLLELNPEERAHAGIFLSFQYPSSLPGVSVSNFLKASVQSKYLNDGRVFKLKDFYTKVFKFMDYLNLDRSFSTRQLNVNFSGGEKKKFEMLQMLLLEPKLIILDEVDSGLDIDALKILSKVINLMLKKECSILIVTHHGSFLEALDLKNVFVMSKGTVVKKGGPGLLTTLEKDGYSSIV